MFAIIAELTGYNIDVLMLTAATLILSLHFFAGRHLLEED